MISFLLVGLVASVKVGGGTNLHNLDMFFVGMVFMTTIAWLAGIDIEIGTLMQRSRAMRGIMILIVAIPAFIPMVGTTQLELPPVVKVEVALWRIQEYVSCAQEYGEVLFMDQRQLLTFGYVENVILVPEYEKKVVMDQALGENENYFEEFYDDLATSRFSLIIAERQFVQIKDSSDSLAEENNAWVQWVSIPLLQEYEPVASHKLVKIDLFMPIGRNYQCP